MKPTFTTLFGVFLLLGSSHLALAQSLSITGRLLQEDTGEPLAFATVILYATADSSMVANALSENDGQFRLQAGPGSYYLEVTYVGYEDKRIPDIQLRAGEGDLELGAIDIRSSSVALEEIEVRAERSQMEFKLDRRVFNVGKDLTNAGNTAADILDNVPSVTVDPEGNVSLRGSQGVRILVNGKPSGLLSADDTRALLRMQGDLIESVEVITNPSARYEAEGEAGIINIILKKNKDKGVNGSFGLTAGYPQNFGASYNLNYRKRNFNLFSNFGLDYRRFPGGGFSTQRFFDPSGQLTDYFTTETDQTRGGPGGYLQVGTDWLIDEENTLTGSVLYRLGRDNNDALVTYRDFTPNEELLNTTVRDIAELEKEHNFESSLLYRRTFRDHPDRELTVDVKYILDDDTELADYVQTTTDGEPPLIQRSRNTEDERNFLFQTDYVHPLGENSKFETGVRLGMRTVNNDFLVEEQADNGKFIPVGDFDDELKFTENIYAAYVIGAHEFGPLSIQAGLRAELSDITAALLKSEVVNNQDYLSLFPSASVSYSFSEKDQLQFSYSRRISRPYFRRLLPFSNFNDPRNNNIGNPNLQPEFTNVLESGYLHYFQNGSFLGNIYYRRTTGVIERITLPGEDGTSIRYPVNLSTRNSFGLELNFSYDLTDWWTLNSDVNFFRAITNGEFEGVDYSADTYTWRGRINTRVDVGKRFQFQASYNYIAPERNTQGRRLSISNFDLAASMDVFDGKGTITLTGRDIFNTRIRRSIIDLPELQAESEFQWRRSQRVVVSFNYRLNQAKKRSQLLEGDRG